MAVARVAVEDGEGLVAAERAVAGAVRGREGVVCPPNECARTCVDPEAP